MTQEDRKDIMPHFFYKKECNGYLRCVSMRLDETVGLKYIYGNVINVVRRLS